MKVDKNYNRRKAVSFIKQRIKAMAKCCSTIKTLNDAIVLLSGGIISGGTLILDLQRLNPSWKPDIRPLINGRPATYIDFKNYVIFVDINTYAKLNDLDDQSICNIYNYFDDMINL